MNNRQLYLAWLRTAAPTVYTAALRKATGQIKNLGGLGDDLLQQALSPNIRHSFLGDDGSSIDTSDTFDSSTLTDTSPIQLDPIIFQPPTFDPGTVSLATPEGVGPAPVAAAPAASSGSSSTFSNILTAVASIGSTVVNASQQSALIALNTQRAAQGLPPVNAQGQVVTAAGTATTSAALLAFENAIAGGSAGSLVPILLIGGLLAYFLLGRSST